MVDVLRRIFHIYPGEEKRAFLFAFLAFTWALGVTTGVQFSNAIFLLNIGSDSLPTAYSMTAIGLMITATFLLYSVHVVTPHRIFVTILGAACLFYSFICVCLLLDVSSSYLWFILKVCSYLLFSVVITSFWLFVDQYYHLQDAKRLFGLFSSSIFIGAAGTGLLLRSAVMDSHHLVMVILTLLLCALVTTQIISKQIDQVHDDSAPEGNSGISWHSLRQLVRSILTSRFTILLLCINLLTQILLVITEYNVLSDFQARFAVGTAIDPDDATEAQLTIFMGQWVAIISICNLLFGLFVYGRLIRRFGVTMLVFSTPLILLVTFSGWISSHLLLFPIMGYFVVEGTLIVIDDSNFALLLNAVPQKVKYKIRVIIESFFEPVGMLASSLLLTFFADSSKILGLVLSLLAIVVALGLRKQYLGALFRNLSDNAILFTKQGKDWLLEMKPKDQKAAEIHLLAILKQGDVRAKAFACEGLFDFEDESVLKQMLKIVDKSSVKSKIVFLHELQKSIFTQSSIVIDQILLWLREERDFELKSALHLYLAKLGLLHPERVFQDLQGDNLELRGAAIIALKTSLANQTPSIAAYNRTLAAQELELLLDSDDEQEVCMGIAILGIEELPGNVEILLPLIKSSLPKVAHDAAIALANIIDKQSQRHASELVAQLTKSTDNEYRLAILKALGEVGDSTVIKEIILSSIHFRPNERRLTERIIAKMGLRTVPALLGIVKDSSWHDRCRMLAGRILAQIALPQLQANLYEIINTEIERAFFYYYHQATIQKKNPNLDLSLLTDCLQSGFYSVLDFIIQILGSAGSVDDAELLSRSLRNRNPKTRAQVVEALEKTCDIKIFRMLQPLVSDFPIQEKLRSYEKLGLKVGDLEEVLDWLIDSPLQADKIVAATYQCRLNMPNWRQSLRKQMASNEELFHHFAYELLESLP